MNKVSFGSLLILVKMFFQDKTVIIDKKQNQISILNNLKKKLDELSELCSKFNS